MSLRELRESRGLTQVELSQRSGLSQENISRIERTKNPRVDTLQRYLEGLGAELGLAAVFGNERHQLRT